MKKKINSPKVTQILVGPDSFWTSNLKNALEKISEDYLLVLVDDFYLINLDKKFNFETTIKTMKKNNLFHLKFHNIPKAKILTDESNIFAYDKEEPYCISVCGFWKKSSLKKLCYEKENAWDFEIKSAIRSKSLGMTGSYLNPPLYCLNLIEKGKWSRKISKNFLVINGFDINKRKFGSFFSNVNSFFKEILFNLILKINWKLRIKIINIIKKILVVY
jgi:hypothetical protein